MSYVDDDLSVKVSGVVVNDMVDIASWVADDRSYGSLATCEDEINKVSAQINTLGALIVMLNKKVDELCQKIEK